MALLEVPNLSHKRFNETAGMNNSFNIAIAWIWNIGPPIILVIGSFGSIMILLIFRKIKTGTSTVFFKTLAVADLCSMHTGLLNLFLTRVFSVPFDAISAASCKLFFFSMHFSSVLSSWLIVSMTVQRALSVIWPHRVSIVCSNSNSKFFCLGLVLWTMLLHCHMLYGLDLQSFSIDTAPVCVYLTEEYGAFFDFVWTWMDLILSSLLPSALLIASNCVLVWSLMRARDKSLTAVLSDQLASRKKKASSITVTLIVVSAAFFVLTNPYCIFMLCLPYALDRYDSEWEFRAGMNTLYVFVNLLWYLNSASNFYIYCLTGSKFRCEAKRILCLCKKQSLSS